MGSACCRESATVANAAPFIDAVSVNPTFSRRAKKNNVGELCGVDWGEGSEVDWGELCGVDWGEGSGTIRHDPLWVAGVGVVVLSFWYDG